MLNCELYMRFTCILHPGCNFLVMILVISAEICCNWMQVYAVIVLHTSLHEKNAPNANYTITGITNYTGFKSITGITCLRIFITKTEIPSLVYYMYITSITHILQQLHVLHTLYICIILFTFVVITYKWPFV